MRYGSSPWPPVERAAPPRDRGLRHRVRRGQRSRRAPARPRLRLVVADGSYTELRDGLPRRCATGTAIYHAPGEVHADYFAAEGRCVNFEIRCGHGVLPGVAARHVASTHPHYEPAVRGRVGAAHGERSDARCPVWLRVVLHEFSWIDRFRSRGFGARRAAPDPLRARLPPVRGDDARRYRRRERIRAASSLLLHSRTAKPHRARVRLRRPEPPHQRVFARSPALAAALPPRLRALDSSKTAARGRARLLYVRLVGARGGGPQAHRASRRRRVRLRSRCSATFEPIRAVHVGMRLRRSSPKAPRLTAVYPSACTWLPTRQRCDRDRRRWCCRVAVARELGGRNMEERPHARRSRTRRSRRARGGANVGLSRAPRVLPSGYRSRGFTCLPDVTETDERCGACGSRPATAAPFRFGSTRPPISSSARKNKRRWT